MAQQVWNDLVNELKPLESVIKVSAGEKTITFKNGGQLSIKSGHEPDRLRGDQLVGRPRPIFGARISSRRALRLRR
jgi:hypothetical protein